MCATHAKAKISIIASDSTRRSCRASCQIAQAAVSALTHRYRCAITSAPTHALVCAPRAGAHRAPPPALEPSAASREASQQPSWRTSSRGWTPGWCAPPAPPCHPTLAQPAGFAQVLSTARPRLPQTRVLLAIAKSVTRIAVSSSQQHAPVGSRGERTPARVPGARGLGAAGLACGWHADDDRTPVCRPAELPSCRRPGDLACGP
jgi:hypothetical protein